MDKEPSIFLLFCNRLVLSVTFSRFRGVVACVWTSFIFVLNNRPFYAHNHVLFVRSLAGGGLGYHFLTLCLFLWKMLCPGPTELPQTAGAGASLACMVGLQHRLLN